MNNCGKFTPYHATTSAESNSDAGNLPKIEGVPKN